MAGVSVVTDKNLLLRTVWPRGGSRTSWRCAKLLGLITGAAIIRPDMYFGMVAEGRNPGEALDKWFRERLCLQR